MLCRITLEPSRLPLVPLLAGAGPSFGSSNTCEPLEDCDGADAWCAPCRRWIASRCKTSLAGLAVSASGTCTITWPSQWGQRPFLPAYLSLTLNVCPLGHSH